ncbi:MAG TPA: hypothetical protein VD962_13030, partial [Rubricoccaceae bacterium]|nr:hypothetical protein [Rubricoccaceae bacterium]
MRAVRSFSFAALAALCLLMAVPAAAQPIPGLGRVRDAVRGAVANPVSRLLEGEPPITTGLEDARWGDASKDGFTPREAERSLLTLERTPNGGFVLQPGYFSMQTQS